MSAEYRKRLEGRVQAAEEEVSLARLEESEAREGLRVALNASNGAFDDCAGVPDTYRMREGRAVARFIAAHALLESAQFELGQAEEVLSEFNYAEEKAAEEAAEARRRHEAAVASTVAAMHEHESRARALNPRVL